jgi:hypothetical protein
MALPSIIFSRLGKQRKSVNRNYDECYTRQIQNFAKYYTQNNKIAWQSFNQIDIGDASPVITKHAKMRTSSSVVSVADGCEKQQSLSKFKI